MSFNLSYPEEIIIREICFKKKIKFFVETQREYKITWLRKKNFCKIQKNLILQ